MAVVFVARSATLTKWGAEVGLGKTLFYVGSGEGSGEEAVAALNAQGVAGVDDWALVRQQPAEIDADTVLERVGRKEKVIDPHYYPRLRGARNVVAVKLANVENHILIKTALEGQDPKVVKPKAADIGNYLLAVAIK